ncbi:EscE/YscE/SsaE family type III secretion system needle protein co-chaperone [Yersinia intermedia]|uniref:EscE/YscE/SsaE family type III secretion system needle protein co-chaperone n=1 Tax=Yersinia intermedia TaxID=631 RepID=UPI0005E792BE|nr:EscE/YscE/SsaE family type III secretion system needle protein co-chaperone [Yersinia intermedia]MCB5314294.1 EscE/YscE/SsaE family type III secretion system needle protein co-chaperone [Yersinia intermedia]MCB5323960.1 EscE/YscE/SsaE family type III secretion system needle protein co-chaperone [Yersinia intermedia]MCB5328170.1 EscE/YscE/SsaE family type III secretion system needle protein co-chaperone [Yersinia intermedia]UNK23148.1 EscE/YscE/SsaE family type III secretion system needle pro
MSHITELEDAIKYDAKKIQQKNALLASGKLLISQQLSLQQTPDNYKTLNNMMLALSSAEKIIAILSARYGN